MDTPIELPDNNFIAIRSLANSTSGWGNLLYAEFANGTDGNVDFAEGSVKHYELFDVDADPWHLNNIYDTAPQKLKDTLHAEVHNWLACKEDSCP